MVRFQWDFLLLRSSDSMRALLKIKSKKTKRLKEYVFNKTTEMIMNRSDFNDSRKIFFINLFTSVFRAFLDFKIFWFEDSRIKTAIKILAVFLVKNLWQSIYLTFWFRKGFWILRDMLQTLMLFGREFP